MRSIKSKVVVSVGVIVLVFSILLLYRNYVFIKSHIEEQVQQQVGLGLDFVVASRGYFAEKVRPLMYELVGPETFIPATMSTSFAARSIFETVRKDFPDYIIKFSAGNPRNPANLAGPEELRMVDYFDQNQRESTWAGEVGIMGRQYFAKFSALRMEEKCLRCHGDPRDAPEQLIKIYGSAGGFHFPLGKTVGLDTVAIPVDNIKKQLWSETANSLVFSIVAILLLVVSLVMVFKFVISDRLGVMAKHFVNATEQRDASPIEPVAIKGRDEISVVASSFNVLARDINESKRLLKTKVAERTAALTEINERLKIEIGQRERTEATLQETLDGLEQRVRERTKDLERTNERLKGEMSERQRAQEALGKSEERFRALVEASSDWIWEVDQDGVYTYASPKVKELLGWEPPELIGKAPFDLMPSDVADRVRGIFQGILASRKPFSNLENTNIHKDGRLVVLETNGVPIFDADGDLKGYRGIDRDITARKEAEEALREKEAELRVKAENLEDVNTALRVLLKEREKDKTGIEEKTLASVKSLILPYLEKLRNTRLNNIQMSCVDILESNLKNIIAPFSQKLSSKYRSFTPTEIMVANLVKEGKTTKEIAEFMNLSHKTIQSHRDNIRKKLGINKRPVNLRSYLLSP